MPRAILQAFRGGTYRFCGLFRNRAPGAVTVLIDELYTANAKLEQRIGNLILLIIPKVSKLFASDAAMNSIYRSAASTNEIALSRNPPRRFCCSFRRKRSSAVTNWQFFSTAKARYKQS